MYNKIPIKGQRAALKLFKQAPHDLGIYVTCDGHLYAAEPYNADPYDLRVDLRARITYKVCSIKLTETMVKTIASELVNNFYKEDN